MNKFRKTCSVCESTTFQRHDSVVRESKARGKTNRPRYKCQNEHLFTHQYAHLKRICERWVRHLALRLRERGVSYRVAEKKTEEFIIKTGINRVLGRKSYTHAAIRKWVLKRGVLTESQQGDKIYQNFLDSLDACKLEKAQSMGSAEVIKTGTYQRFEWAEQMKNSILETFKNAPEFRSLIRDSMDIDWVWCLKMAGEMYNVAEEKPWEEGARLLKKYPEARRFFKGTAIWGLECSPPLL